MTDEKKAEEYAVGKAHEHYHFLFEENNGSPADFAKLCYLDGLVEGKKESAELKEENKKLKEKLKKVQNYLVYEIPHDLMNEATKKIYKMV